MENVNFVFDITKIDIDLSLDKPERIKKVLENVDIINYNKKIMVNGTVIYMNFLSDEKLKSSIIMKVLN